MHLFQYILPLIISKSKLFNVNIRKYCLSKIIEIGSFSKAAEAMGYSQSAMGQMISSLEEEMSIKLINRFRTGAKLTLEGEKLNPFIEKLIEKINEIKGLETDTIRMATLAGISAHWLPNLLKDKDKSSMPIACKRFIELLQSHLNELP